MRDLTMPPPGVEAVVNDEARQMRECGIGGGDEET